MQYYVTHQTFLSDGSVNTINLIVTTPHPITTQEDIENLKTWLTKEKGCDPRGILIGFSPMGNQ